MDINLLCSSLIDALRKAGYKESTIINYQGLVRRFNVFCQMKGVSKYSSEIGRMYADDVVSLLTGKFSKQRYISQGRFFRLLDSFYNTGEFDFSCKPRNRVQPSNDYYLRIYERFCSDLKTEYDNENTRHFYEYGMYSLLQYLENNGIFLQLEKLTSTILIEYLTQSKPNRQREVLCELRKICRYLERNDLLIALAGIHTVRHKRIIPILDHEEQEQIKAITTDETVPLRDTAMILLGLSTGIRACDIIRLRLSDIDWVNDTITWKQSKTGNVVCLPLIPSVGNTIARYIVEQRPPAPNNYLFVRMLAPFDPLSSHSSCYVMVKRVLEKAGINKNDRMWGMHLLRHNAASTMVKNEVAIETIAAILGHADADTTGIYITTDEKRLKECVLPFGAISKEVHA